MKFKVSVRLIPIVSSSWSLVSVSEYLWLGGDHFSKN